MQISREKNTVSKGNSTKVLRHECGHNDAKTTAEKWGKKFGMDEGIKD